MPKALPLASESSHFDANQVPSLVVVQGTLGTSDATGSAPTMPIGGNPLTGGLYVEQIGGTTVNIGLGTITRISNLGTVESGTFRIDSTPTASLSQQGTLGTAGGSFFGTLSAASGAGTKHYVSGVDIVVQSGTVDVRVLAGTVIQGTGVLAAGAFAPNGGISKQWWPHYSTGTNSELIYHLVGAGTAFINISYWKGV